MKESNAIIIMQVGNGFIVRPPSEMRNGNFIPDSDVHVFQTMDALLGYIKNHFTDQKEEQNTFLTTEIIAREYARVYGVGVNEGLEAYSDLSRYSKAALSLSLEDFSKKYIKP